MVLITSATLQSPNLPAENISSTFSQLSPRGLGFQPFTSWHLWEHNVPFWFFLHIVLKNFEVFTCAPFRVKLSMGTFLGDVSSRSSAQDSPCFELSFKIFKNIFYSCQVVHQEKETRKESQLREVCQLCGWKIHGNNMGGLCWISLIIGPILKTSWSHLHWDHSKTRGMALTVDVGLKNGSGQSLTGSPTTWSYPCSTPKLENQLFPFTKLYNYRMIVHINANHYSNNIV